MVIVARGLTREYDGGVRALNGVDTEVPEGEFVAVTGPSGCGVESATQPLSSIWPASVSR